MKSSNACRQTAGNKEKGSRPNFVTSMTDAMFEQGSNIQMEGIMDGHPNPDIKWNNNLVQIKRLEDNDGLHIGYHAVSKIFYFLLCWRKTFRRIYIT